MTDPSHPSYMTPGARRAFRRYRRDALIGFLVLLVGVLAALHTATNEAEQARQAIIDSARVVVVDGCNRDFIDRMQVRGVLIASRREARALYHRGEINRENYLSRLAFYREQLHNLPLPDCRRAPDILTDDPGEIDEVRDVDPLYPGHPGTRG